MPENRSGPPRRADERGPAWPVAGVLRRLGGLHRAFRRHPLTADDPKAAWLRWARWQVRSRLWSAPAVVPFVGDTRLLVRRGDFGATGNLYFGLHEAESMAFVGHLLRPGDLFVDVGANVGTYTVLAAGVCGARVLACEPVPGAHRSLVANIVLNGLDGRARAVPVALGAADGRVTMTAGLDVVNHVLGRDETAATSVSVAVTTLDALLSARPSGPFFVKVDVEGYEAAVVAGATATLRSPELLGLLLEMTPQAHRYAFDDGDLHAHLLSQGLHAFDYDLATRTLTPREAPIRRGNMLYLRDVDAARARTSTAAPLRVLDRTV
jgi:FkbM family methyltransferase